MASPNSRDTLIQHSLRRLGMPVIEVNVDEEQIEDCVDDVLQFYQEFHSDATKRTYISYQITADDVTQKSIPIPANILTVVRLLPFDQSSIGVGTGMFSIKYQMAMSDLISGAGGVFADLAYYSQLGQYLETLDMVLTGVPQVTFSRHEDRLIIHGEWFDQQLKVGDWVVYEVYQIIDPQAATSIYNDKFVKNYLTAMIKQRWGQNMSKFDGVQLPGGVTISGKAMYDEATQELAALEVAMRSEYEPMPDFYIG
jgi:hypothetical protein